MGCIIVTVAGLIMIKKWLILKERHFLEIHSQMLEPGSPIGQFAQGKVRHHSNVILSLKLFDHMIL